MQAYTDTAQEIASRSTMNWSSAPTGNAARNAKDAAHLKNIADMETIMETIAVEIAVEITAETTIGGKTHFS